MLHMKGFAGFSTTHARLVPVPDAFFTELLPQIDTLLELKVTLHLFWLLYHRQGLPKAIARSELEADGELLRSLKTVQGRRPAQESLREGLERAVARGTVLSLSVCEVGGARERWYFLNTPASRQALGRVEGHSQAVEEMLPVHTVEVVRVQRPNIFTLYEQNIGPLTPLVADELRAAELEYPAAWIEDAMRQAVEYNKRNWRYVRGVLRRWQTGGRGHGGDARHSEQDADPERYRRGKY